MKKARSCAFQVNYHLIYATKYRRRVLVGMVKVRLEEIIKDIAERHGYELIAAKVDDGDHVHLFVSAPPAVSIPEIVRNFKCVSALKLFRVFPQIRRQLWCGHLWSDGYAVRTAGDVSSDTIESYIKRTERQ